MPRMYEELADWYTLITAPSEYEAEARWYAQCLRDHAQREVESILELGSGAGANASYLKSDFHMVLVDASKKMLQVSKELNPELEHRVGDMKKIRLKEDFDAVFVHDAASYLKSEDDVRRTAETAAAHLRPGGVLLFCPDDLQENFKPGLESGGHDGDDGRGLRYLAWSIPSESPNLVITDYAFILKTPDGKATAEYDRHITGRLPRASWIAALEAAGFSAQVIPFDLAEEEVERYEVVVGVLPNGPGGQK
jgi:SAM-dependent methyltransferase